MRPALPSLSSALLACALTLASGPALACSVCCCGDPLLGASEAAPISGQARLDVKADHLTASAQSDDDPAVRESLSQTTLKLVGAYSPSERLNLVLAVPVVFKQWSATDGQTTRRASPVGLGDLEVGARLFLVESLNYEWLTRQSFGLLAGTSFPTGRNGDVVDGVRLDDHAQIGTGSFGPYVGAQYRIQRDPWNGFASVSGRTHTTSGFGYRYGDALLWTVQAQVLPIERVALSLGIDGRYAQHDLSNDSAQENTGGLVLAVSPGVLVRVVDDLWFVGRVQVPFVTQLFGSQSVGPTFELGLQYKIG